MQRYFIEETVTVGQSLQLTGETAHHAQGDADASWRSD